ncbi:MAG: restriction endonuclease [Euryarchaeota archaeon]|nr:restriction endonuclease [Euryarchaeota archaeon]
MNIKLNAMLSLQKDIEVPLLEVEVLVELGGQGKPKDIYPPVTKKFPQIRPEDIAERLDSGSNRWTNRIQWVRQKLVEKGEIDRSAHGLWRITEKGRLRLGLRADKVEKEISESGEKMVAAIELKPSQLSQTYLELYEEYEASFHAQLLDKLNSLSPYDFEKFARRLLEVYGFEDVNVTQKSRDGGIDGNGKLRVGLAIMNVAFQCKKWQGNVGRQEVDKFRGAIQGEFEQGIFFTTSDFTPEARDASLKKGAVPIVLLNGESIVSLMIEKGFGVQRVPLYAYYERPSDLKETDED